MFTIPLAHSMIVQLELVAVIVLLITVLLDVVANTDLSTTS